MRFLRRMSLRARLTLAATLVAALGLAVGGTVMVVALERAILGSLDDSARADGRDIAALVDTGQLTDPLPSFGAAVAQVVDVEGRVRASTPGGDRLAPILGPQHLDAARDGAAIELDGTRFGQPDPYRVVGVPAGPPGDPQTVLVAVSLAGQVRAGQLVRWAAFVVAVVLTGGLAVLSWLGIGQALRPVEELRRGADEISGTAGPRRLPVPEADDEIRRLATTLNDMLVRLDAASARQRAFVADAAHELRSPIAVLRTELEVQLAHPGAVDPDETAREALVEVERMATLVDDLLVLARLDEGGRSRATTRIDVGEVADDAVHHLPNPRVPVGLAMSGSVLVQGDADALTRVTRNLLDNAVRHASSRVDVSVSGDGAQVVLSVRDDGAGIPEADRSRIFERFARLDDARSRGAGGTGLGLAIVKEIVRVHGGTVHVEDAEPGARFVVRIPTAPTRT
jgi:signal transduction histidine kinase